ncbi:MAG: hypothetical protein QXH87_03460 [Candidatus Bathyarchaeia archaeon]
MRFIVKRGKKSSKDLVIHLYSNGEVLSIADLLRVLKLIFESENANYPLELGKRGACYLLNAITEVAFGRDLNRVLKDYGLNHSNSEWIFQVEPSKPINKLHEVLE